MPHSGPAGLRAGCWACGQSPLDTLALVDEHGVPPAENGHNIIYGHTRLGICPRCGSLQIERLDHDCFDYEAVWDQYEWYTLDHKAMPAMRELLAGCRTPLDPACQCATHQYLRAECGALPSSCWTSALEANRHVHRLRLRVSEGRLHLEPADTPQATCQPQD